MKALLDFLDHFVNAIENLIRLGIISHVGRRSVDLVLLIHTDLTQLLALYLIPQSLSGIHAAIVRPFITFGAKSESDTRAAILGAQDFCCKDRSYASKPDDFLLLVEGFQCLFDISLHCHVATLECEIRQVLGGTETSRKEDGIEL